MTAFESNLTQEGRARREYPEASLSVIGAIVMGLMGITVDPITPFQSLSEGGFTDRILRTLPGPGAVIWADLSNLPVRANQLTARDEGNWKTSLTNQTGPAAVWEASFEGTRENLLFEGKPARAHVGRRSVGRSISSVTLTAGAGDALTVEVPR